MSKIYVLDACAMVALLKNESGADAVADAYKQAENGEAKIIINRINLLEVFYGFYHDDGDEYADKILNGVEESIVEIAEFTREIFLIARHLKATYRISLADSIALAQAIALNGELLTADHHEFDMIVGKEPVRLLWIR